MLRPRKEIEAENEKLKEIIRDLHVPARRYSDGRSTYITSTLNRHVRYLLSIGMQLNWCDGTLFARDGMGRMYDGLTDDEAKQGPPLELWRYSVLTEGYEEGA